MILRVGRKPPSPTATRLLYPKIAVFVIGAAAALYGMVAHIDWIVTTAIVILALGFLLRFIGREREGPDSYEDDYEDDEPLDD